MGSPFAANSVGPLHGSDGRCLSVEFSLAAIFSSDSGSLRGPDAPTETAIGGRFDRFPAFDSCHYSDVAPQNRRCQRCNVDMDLFSGGGDLGVVRIIFANSENPGVGAGGGDFW